MAEPIAWTLIRSFLAVMEGGSLSAAARETGLTQPTIGRHIDQLEATLASPLFVRAPSGLTPTATALAMLPHARAMATAAAALVRTASAPPDAAAGVVRITASAAFGAHVLPSLLVAVQDRHPGLIIELAATDKTEDLSRREADIAVRNIHPRQDALVARRIGSVTIGLYARHDYLARYGTPASLDDLGRHRLIGFDQPGEQVHQRSDLPFPFSRDLFHWRSDNEAAQLATLRAGGGIGYCQTPIARRDPALVRVLTDQFAVPLEVWLVMHEDVKTSRRVRLVFDHLATGLQAYVRDAHGD